MAYEKYCQENDESWEQEKQIKVLSIVITSL